MAKLGLEPCDLWNRKTGVLTTTPLCIHTLLKRYQTLVSDNHASTNPGQRSRHHQRYKRHELAELAR